MATVKSLEDMLSSEVDESAVTALVGSLESQLASSNIQISSQDVNSPSVTVNHVNNAIVVDGNVARLVDGQKQGANAVTQTISLVNISKPAVVASQISDANSVATTSNASNVVATLPGALPASGYITQVTGPSQQSFFTPVSGTKVVSRPANNQDIKLVYTTQSIVSQLNSGPTANTRSKTAIVPNGSSPGSLNMISIKPNQPIVTVSAMNPVLAGSSTSMSAIHDLANIASQQSPIVIPNTCTSSIQVVTATSQVAIANGKPITAGQNLTDSKLVENPGKNSSPITVTQSTMIPQLSTNVIQVNNSTVVSKGLVTTSQPVSVVSQVVTNPSLLPPGVQIVNVNPSRLGVTTLSGQKTLAPRMMLATNPVRIAAAPQILTARAGVAGQRCMSQISSIKSETTFAHQRHAIPRIQAPIQKLIPYQHGNKNTITLQPGGLMRGAVLLKTENGQLQVVNISSASGSPIPGTATYRLQSLPAGTTGVRTLSPQQIVTLPVSAAGLKANQVSVTAPQTIVGTILQQTNSRLANPNTTAKTTIQGIKAGINGNLSTPLTVQTATANSQPSTPTQMSPNTAKKKCKNFLSTLIRLADEQPAAVAKSVRNLIQGIIDGTMQAEEFTTKLQKELNSAPRPYLVPFLKKNLPYLRHSLITKELTIEGVRPPPPGAMIMPHPHLANLQVQLNQKRPQIQQNAQVRLMSGSGGVLNTQLLQQSHGVLTQRFAAPRLTNCNLNQTKSLLVTSQGKLLSGSSIATSSPATLSALQSKYSISAKNSFITPKDQGKRNFSALRDDDDINDVAAMGGVNLIEESQKILASNAELVGTQIRSCKEESFLFPAALQRRIHSLAAKHGIEEVSQDVINLISHASQARLKTLIEKLSVITEHRIETPKTDSRYEITQNVKCQIKFVEELDRLEKRRHDEQEEEILLRAAKSRSKLEDPEQLKLKQKAKEMQRAKLEELRQREANTTALLAIGPRKKTKLDPSISTLNQTALSTSPGTSGNTSKLQARPRVKRVNLRDLLYLMEQEKETVRSPLLYKSYLK